MSIEELRFLFLLTLGLILLVVSIIARILLETGMHRSYEPGDLAIGRFNAWLMCFPPMVGGLYFTILALLST